MRNINRFISLILIAAFMLQCVAFAEATPVSPILEQTIQSREKVSPDPQLAEIRFDTGRLELAEGQTHHSVVEAVYSDGSTYELTSGVAFNSSDREVAAVDAGGTIQALAPGKAEITAAYMGRSASLIVTVAAAQTEIKDIALDMQEYALPIGGTHQTVVAAVYADGSTAILSEGITFESSNSQTATVDAAGLVTAVAPGTAQITAKYGGLASASTVKVQTPVDPPVLSMEEKDGKVYLGWTSVTDAVYYNVKRGTSPGKLQIIASSVKETSFVDGDIHDEVTYFYAVTAVKDGVESKNSNIATRPRVPEAPILYGLRKIDGIKLNWTIPYGAEKFVLYRGTSPGGPYETVAEGAENQYIDTKAVPEVTCYYVAKAYDNKGRSSKNSNEIKVEPLARVEQKFDPAADDDGDNIKNEDELLKGSDIKGKDKSPAELSGSPEAKAALNVAAESAGDPSVRKTVEKDGKTQKKDVPKKLKRQFNSKDNKVRVEVFGDDALDKAPLKAEQSRHKFLKSLKGAVGEPVELSAGDIDIHSAVITMQYDRNALNGVREEDLKIYWYDEENNRLVALDSKVDKASQMVTAETSHFSTYLLGGTMEVNLSLVDLVFVIDQSQGMGVIDPGGHRLDLAKRFTQQMYNLNLGVTTMPDSLRIGLVEFSDFASVKAAPTAVQADLAAAEGTMNHTIGATNVADGIWVGKAQFDMDNTQRRRIMVLMTDGNDNLGNMDAQIEQIVKNIQDNKDINPKMVINTVAIGSDCNTRLLQNIAEITGGGYFTLNITPASTPQEIDDQVKLIYDKLIRQITFDKAAEPPAAYTQGTLNMTFSDKYKGYDSDEARRLYTNAHTNLLTGNFAQQTEDIRINSTGPDLAVERTYNSEDGKTKTMLGNGWRLNYDSTVKEISAYGRVIASGLNLRAEPGTGKPVVTVLQWGTEVSITGDGGTVDGYSWSKVKLSDGREGYAASTYIDSAIGAGAELTYGSGTRAVFLKNSDGSYKLPYGVYDTLAKTAQGYKLTRKDQTVYNFDTAGKLAGIVDKYGNTITIAYNGDKIATVTDPAGRQLKFDYNAGGLLWKVTDPLNRVVEYSYDANNNLTGVFDLSGKKTTYSYYDEFATTINPDQTTTQAFKGSRIKQVLDANGHQVIKNDYDVYGRMVRQYDGNNNIKYHIYKDIYTNENYELLGTSEMARYFIDENGNESKTVFNPVTKLPVKEMDAYGKTVEHKDYIYFYGTGNYGDGQWKEITNIQAPLNPANIDNPEYAEYKEFLRAVNNGNRHTKEETRDKKGYSTVTIYDKFKNPIELTDARLNKAIMAYDAKNNLINSKDKKNNETIYTYDPEGVYLQAVTDPMGNTIRYEYYSVGTGVVMKGLLKKVTENRKAKNGTVVSDFNTTEYKYEDGYNNRTESIDSLGRSTKESYDAAGRVKQVTDARNFTTKYTYDNMDRLTQEEDALANRSRIQYDNAGNKRFVTDKNGYTTEYVYDNENQLIKVIDAKGGKIEYRYDPIGNRLAEINQKGGVTEYDYDAVGRLVQEKDPVGAVTKYEYDVDAAGTPNAAGVNNVKVTDPLLRVSITEYDELYRKVKDRVLYKEGGSLKEKVTQYTYDANGNPETATDALGKVTKNEYDSLNRLTRVTDGLGLGSLENATTTDYDAFGDASGKFEKITVTDALLHPAAKEINGLGQTVKVTDAKLNSTVYTYDEVGNQKTVTDARGNTTTYEYDALNRVKKVFDATGVNYSEMEYDAVGNNTAKTDRRKNRTEFHYNSLNQLVETVDSLGKTTRYSYDEAGNQKSITDANGNTTGYAYNRKNQLVTELDAGGYAKYYRYDAAGNKIFESTKKNEYVGATYAYDSLNRLERVIDAEGTPAIYTYDVLGNLLSQKDGEDRTISYQYDPMHRLYKKVDGAGKEEVYPEYDRAGNLKTKIDRNGITTAYEYDEQNRLKKEAAGTDTREFTYDEVGNVKTTVDETGTTVYAYDRLNRLDDKTLPGSRTVDYDYDAEGNNTYLKDPEGNTTTYQYDAANRLWKVTTAEGTSTYEYDANGNRKSLTLAGGAKTNYEYNTRNLLTRLENVVNGVTSTYQYDYDADRLQVYKLEPKGRTDFEYDDLGRVKVVVEPNGRRTEYTYDRAGNRKTQTVSGGGVNATITYDYNGLNRLTGTTEVRNGTTTNTSYDYDSNGNQTRVAEGSNISSYTYDKFNRLRTASPYGGASVTNKYDAFGRRTQKTAGGVTVTYCYDGQDVILESGSDGRKAKNIYGTTLLARNDGSGALYYLYNGHADVVKLVNTSGSLVNEYDYDIFGNTLLETESRPNPYRYAGYYYDTETRYYYLNARYYDPKTARFITEDSFYGYYDDPLSLNLYTYCHNDPVNYYDPSGYFNLFSGDDWKSLGQNIKHATIDNVVDGFTTLIDSEKRKEAFEVIDKYGSTTDKIMSRVYAGTAAVAGTGVVVIGGVILAEAAPAIAAASPTAAFIMANAEPIAYGTPGLVGGASAFKSGIENRDVGQAIQGAAMAVLGGYMLKNTASNYVAMNSNVGISSRISSTLTAEEIKAANAVNLRMQYAGASEVSLNPSKINFSQRSVSENVVKYTEDMKAGNWDWSRSGPLKVMERDGQWVSYDNRRLMAAQQAGLDSVPVQVVKPTELVPGKNSTWEKAFIDRFNDFRNIKLGGPVPNSGLGPQPSIVVNRGGR